MSRTGRYRRFNGIATAVALVALALPLMFEVTPAGDGLRVVGGPRIPELCLVKRLTGHPCASCHLGRSVVYAVHGNLGASFSQHHLGIYFVTWLLAQAALRIALTFWGSSRIWIADVIVTAASFVALAAAARW